jgi:hypothetical protein
MKKPRYVQMTYTRVFRIDGTESDKEALDGVLDGKGTPITDYKPMRGDTVHSIIAHVLTTPSIYTVETSNEPKP